MGGVGRGRAREPTREGSTPTCSSARPYHDGERVTGGGLGGIGAGEGEGARAAPCRSPTLTYRLGPPAAAIVRRDTKPRPTRWSRAAKNLASLSWKGRRIWNRDASPRRAFL